MVLTFTGWSDKNSNEGEPLLITILTVNAKGKKHQHTTKRPLKEIKRKNVGQELENNLTCYWRRGILKIWNLVAILHQIYIDCLL